MALRVPEEMSKARNSVFGKTRPRSLRGATIVKFEVLHGLVEDTIVRNDPAEVPANKTGSCLGARKLADQSIHER